MYGEHIEWEPVLQACWIDAERPIPFEASNQ